MLAAPPEILAPIARGAVVITPHERAARFIRSVWDQEQRRGGLSTWPTSAAMSWKAWTAEQWQSLLRAGKTDQVLLNGSQEFYLWQQVLARSPEGFPVPSLSRLAAQCAQAHRRLADCQAVERLLARENMESARFFPRLLRQMLRFCSQGRWLSAAELERSLTVALRQGRLQPCPTDLVLCGFEELTPAQEAVLSAWEEHGGRVERVELVQVQREDASVCQADSPDAEVSAFVTWAREYLGRLPDARVALVVEGLAEERDELDAELRRLFSSGNDASPQQAVSYEFSLGRALSLEPLVQVALDLLRWTQSPLPLAAARRVLLSPHVAMKSSEKERELSARATFDREMGRTLRLRPEISLVEVVALAEDRGSLSTTFRQALQNLLSSELTENVRDAARRRPASMLVHAARATLAGVLWGLDVSSYTFLLRQRWEDMLDELWTLDAVGARFTFTEFLGLLEEQLLTTVFAPESKNASVQIVGPLEAAGQLFDAVWVLHCGNLELPAASSASSLLPLALQREFGMPGGDRELDRRRANRTMTQLIKSANRAVFSYASHTSEGAEQMLASSVERLCSPVHVWVPTPEAPSHRLLTLDRLTDEGPVAALPSRVVAGGARVLELQSACGFRAFAELRLQAREMDARPLGLSALERGSATHEALECLWGEVRGHRALLQMSNRARQQVIRQAAEFGLRRAMQVNREPWAANYLEIQRMRLCSLLERWLAYEQTRPEFSVLGREVTLDHVEVGELLLSFRMDRIDAVGSELVILDYKTSKTSAASAWKGERPQKPQMLLYAALAAGGYLKRLGEQAAVSLGGVAFANVIAGPEMSLDGVERGDTRRLHSKVSARRRADLAESLPEWKRVVERLAAEFSQGEARVDPANYPVTCKRCAQRLLCRVDPESLQFAAQAEDEGSSENG